MFKTLRALYSLGVLVAACGGVAASPATYGPGEASGWFNFGVNVTGLTFDRIVVYGDFTRGFMHEGFEVKAASDLNGNGSVTTHYQYWTVPWFSGTDAVLGQLSGPGLLDGQFSISIGYYNVDPNWGSSSVSVDNLRVALFNGDWWDPNNFVQDVALLPQTAPTVNPGSVPEPSAMALVGLALAGAGCARRRRA